MSAKISPVGTFALSVGECRLLLASLTERVEDHFGVSPDEVTWGSVAHADRVLHALKQIAFAAGIGEEPGL